MKFIIIQLETWRRIVDHFKNAKKVFLTATPVYTCKNKIKSIVGDDFVDQEDNYIAFKLLRNDAINNSIIRDTDFVSVGNVDENLEDVYHHVVDEIIKKIGEHDRTSPNYQHQTMILVLRTDEADTIELIYNNKQNKIGTAIAYHGNINKEGFENLKNGKENIRVLVVCKRAIEGFDRKEISVLGIIRNVQPTSVCLFTQFIGRGIRRHQLDPPGFKCCIISHKNYDKQMNYANFINEIWTDTDPDDDDDDDDDLYDDYYDNIY